MESRKVTETAYFVQITRNENLLRKILGEEADSLRMRNGGEETVANTIFVIFGSEFSSFSDREAEEWLVMTGLSSKRKLLTKIRFFVSNTSLIVV